MNIRLTLTVDECNAVIRALEGQPYREVAELLQQIHGQAAQQINAHQARAAARSTGPRVRAS